MKSLEKIFESFAGRQAIKDRSEGFAKLIYNKINMSHNKNYDNILRKVSASCPSAHFINLISYHINQIFVILLSRIIKFEISTTQIHYQSTLLHCALMIMQSVFKSLFIYKNDFQEKYHR